MRYDHETRDYKPFKCLPSNCLTPKERRAYKLCNFFSIVLVGFLFAVLAFLFI